MTTVRVCVKGSVRFDRTWVELLPDGHAGLLPYYLPHAIGYLCNADDPGVDTAIELPLTASDANHDYFHAGTRERSALADAELNGPIGEQLKSSAVWL